MAITRVEIQNRIIRLVKLLDEISPNFKYKASEEQIGAIAGSLAIIDDLSIELMEGVINKAPYDFKTFPSLAELYEKMRLLSPTTDIRHEKREQIAAFHENEKRFQCFHCKDVGVVYIEEKCKPVFPGGPDKYTHAYRCVECKVGETLNPTYPPEPGLPRSTPERFQ